MRDVPVSGGQMSTVAATSTLRAQNTSMLLRVLWRERQLTRAELAERTGLSASTVSTIIGELEEGGLVQSLGAVASRGGRRPVLVGLRDDVYAELGVELGARHVAVALLDLRGRVLSFEEQKHAVREDPKGTLREVRRLCDQALHTARFSARKVLGIGVAVPSTVDPALPGQLSELIFPAWRGVDVRTALSSYGVPVFVDNDANLGALVEHWWGAGQGASELLYVKVGAGVGAGYIIRGELYRGATGRAGEVGHVPIDPQGKLCICGNRGCLTTLIGSAELAERARAMFGLETAPPLAEIVRRARSGDLTARELVDQVGGELGVVIATLLNLLDVEVVILGGEISTVGDMLLDALRGTVRKRALPSALAQTRIVTGQLGRRTIAIGAATLVLNATLQQQTLLSSQSKGLM